MNLLWGPNMSSVLSFIRNLKLFVASKSEELAAVGGSWTTPLLPETAGFAQTTECRALLASGCNWAHGLRAPTIDNTLLFKDLQSPSLFRGEVSVEIQVT